MAQYNARCLLDDEQKVKLPSQTRVTKARVHANHSNLGYYLGKFACDVDVKDCDITA